MLTNPYNHTLNSTDGTDHRITVDITGEDRALLLSLRPVKGTIQLTISNLLFNLCNELRTLDIHGYRHDGDSILSALVLQRPLTAEQRELLGHTSACVAPQVSTGVHKRRGGTRIRQDTPSDAAQLGDETSSTKRRERVARSATGSSPTHEEGDSTENNRS